MPDFFDNASDMEELHRNNAIKKIRNVKALAFSGHCLCCNEAITQGRFCCAECHEDWEKEERFKKIMGNR